MSSKGFKKGINIDLKKIKGNFQEAGTHLAKKINALVIASAIQNYVPENRGDLAKSLREKVTIENGKIKMQVMAMKDYAYKQHEFVLRHTQQPKGISFAFFGTGPNHSAKYESGYETLKESAPKYASKFLQKPMDYIVSHLDEIIDIFAKSFNKS